MIKERLRTFQESKVDWVKRSANEAAHLLAREGLCLDGCMIWGNGPPDCIVRIIASEISENFV